MCAIERERKRECVLERVCGGESKKNGCEGESKKSVWETVTEGQESCRYQCRNKWAGA